MNLAFVTEARFTRGDDGRVYTEVEGFDHALWGRYLSSFDKLYVVARVRRIEGFKPQNSPVDGNGVEFIELPYYLGPTQYIKVKSKLQSALKGAIMPNTAYILRVPGMIGTTMSNYLHKQNVPYAAEVVGDPYDIFAPGAGLKHILRSYFRWSWYRELKRVVERSSAALYVTRKQLQSRYPVSEGSFSIAASDVILPDSKLQSAPKVFNKTKSDTINLISVGSLAQMYKSPDIVVDAIASLKSKGWNIVVTWLGDGIHRQEMIDYAKSKGVSQNVLFIGNVSAGDGVRQKLASADMFLLVSRTEGLPRAMVEAMGEGLPCIGTRVGGIPELLEDEALVDINDSVMLADRIEHFLSNTTVINGQAARNLEEASSYIESVLTGNRASFFEAIKKLYL